MANQRLTREQKEAMILLQSGTFLEYFDLMLYVHMAVLLNELFFPQSNPKTASLLAAFAFCATFVFRPIGALIFGFIGDRFGRKQTIILTTALMALSCVMMANLPTYENIGITAAWLVTLCRALQGISSMGEVVGAELYLTETVEPPMQYPVVSSIGIANAFGALAALGMASLVTNHGVDWRIAFWAGAIIAGIGATARTRLRETPDFVDMKRRVRKTITRANERGLAATQVLLSKNNPLWKPQVDKVTVLGFFLVNCGRPLGFYFVYVYCSNILKSQFGLTAHQVIQQNFLVAIIECFILIFYACLSWRIYPLKIVKFKFWAFFILILAMPYLLNHITNPSQLLVIQILMVSLKLVSEPATSIFYRQFPLFRRFTYVSGIFAASRALMYAGTSIGLFYLGEAIGHWGLWVVALPVCCGAIWGVHYFDRLEHPDKELFKKPRGKINQQAA